MSSQSTPVSKGAFPVFGLLLMVVASLSAVLGLDLFQSYHQVFAIQRQDAANLSNVIERHIHTYVDKVDVVLREAVHEYTPVLQGQKKLTVLAANRDLLRREISIPEAQVKSLRVIGADGLVIFSAGDSDELPKVNVSDRVYFQKQKSDPDAGLVMSEPILSRFTGKWLFTLSRRMSNPDGSFAGLIQTAIRADHFEAGFASIEVGERGNVSLFSLVDADIRLVARRPMVPDRLGKTFQLSEISAALNAGEVFGFYRSVSKVDGVDRHYFFRRFNALPLLVVVGVATDDLMREWWHKAGLYGLSLLILTLQLVWLVRYQRRLALENQSVLEQKVLERTVELEAAKQAAEAASVAKTQFLATMSHELRTPLNGILGMAELVQMDGLEDEDRYEYGRIILQSGETLLGIVNDILDISTIEAGKVVLHPKQTIPADVLMDAIGLFRALADKKGLEITCDIDPHCQQTFSIDEIRVRQMLGNLVNNAIKFSEKGLIRVSLLVTDNDQQPKRLKFVVQDEGVGISAEKIEQLFQPFSQVDGSSTRAYGGTGLGLSIVKKLAELMGGSVGVDSHLGQGSTFWFEIQAQSLDSAAHPAKPF